MDYFSYMKKIKLLYLVPHLSTGGMPQFVLKRIESLQKFKDQIEIFLIVLLPSGLLLLFFLVL